MFVLDCFSDEDPLNNRWHVRSGHSQSNHEGGHDEPSFSPIQLAGIERREACLQPSPAERSNPEYV